MWDIKKTPRKTSIWKSHEVMGKCGERNGRKGNGRMCKPGGVIKVPGNKFKLMLA